MARFEHSRERGSSSRGRSSRGDSRGRSSRGDSRGRFGDDESRDNRRSGRDFNRGNRDRSEVTMTKVICSSCGKECEVPFKPSSDKPVYCNNCFSKKEKGSSSRPERHSPSKSFGSSRDLELINEKLDKIMDALDIE